MKNAFSAHQHEKLLIIFAREPVLGQVKSRLAKDIGNEKALQIYLFLLRKTLTTFERTEYDVRVHFTPTEKRLTALAPKRFVLRPQKGSTLGHRMLNAFKENCSDYKRIIIIGTDCPFVGKRLIRKAFEALASNSVVIGPSEDGGYYLIGQSEFEPAIFEHIDWGTDRVLEQTLQQCKRLGVRPFLLEELYDIDTIHNVRRWMSKRGNTSALERYFGPLFSL